MSADGIAPSRRERLRTETAGEIQAVALRLMREGGPDAITLRAIARTMGMTAGAIYGYYPTRDALITALIREEYTSLVDAIEAARDAEPVDDPAARLLAWGEAFRRWALANPEGFRLIYGDSVSGYRPPEEGAAPDAEHRACTGLVALVAAAWPHAQPVQTGDEDHWSDFEADFAAMVRGSFPDLPAAAVALALRVWGRMHGLVALEISGHLGPQTRQPSKIYRAELLDVVRSLGLPSPRKPR